MRTTRLDVLLREHDLNEFDLLMIDVEGGELDVLVPAGISIVPDSRSC